ncbi:phosphatidylserine/phosphatidylglycerophosphate/cardiolipin synthase family protein [Haladaptatus sp. QDMS2]|uniref:phospholipase D-like domain-containing protein n=1 Tax=Haladaptatus sp. QDMS2 TaxID=3033391 RepID=UPI0023E89675|nr:phospholipase D family protein [Haladaptatus sp. QDMS2]
MVAEHSQDRFNNLCNDYTIAGSLRDEEAIQTLIEWFEAADEMIASGRAVFNRSGSALGRRAQEAVLIGLLKTEAASRVAVGGSLVDSEYAFNRDRVLEVLTQQRIAVRALESEGPLESDLTQVETLTTVPPGTTVTRLASQTVGPLPSRLRRLLLEARESVRIANPYFDPQQRIIGDIIGLPRKGAVTKILTREVTEPSHRATFNRMHNELDAEARRLLDVRELFELDESGRQAVATHAKVMVVDDSIAYVGSANLTTTSLGSNFEVGVLIEGPPVDDIATIFDEVFASARLVDLPVGGR